MATAEHERELVERATCGDSLALEELLQRYFSRLERHVIPRISSRWRSLIAVEDVLQETFIQAFRDIRKFECQADGSFFNWLKTIADHRLDDTIGALRAIKRGGDWRKVESKRSASRVTPLIEKIHNRSGTPSRAVSKQEIAQAIQVRIASLPPRQRHAIHDHYIRGLSVAEIAAEMRCTSAAVRGLLSHGCKNLAKNLGRSSKWLTH